MKKLVALCMVLVLSLSMTACGGKDKDTDKETKGKTENQETDSLEDSQEDGQADDAVVQYCTLAPEGSSISIDVKVPAGCTEAEYSSETTRVFERSTGKNGSVQYVMTILDQDEASVSETMQQEVQYLLSANADGEEQIMDVQSMDFGAREWFYFAYNMEDLSGYRLWAELSEGGFFTCTVESVGDSAEELDIDALIQELSSAISVYEV